MSQESNLRLLGLSHLIGDDEKLETAIELYMDDVKSGRRPPPYPDTGLFLARCDLELRRLRKDRKCTSLGEYLKDLASKGVKIEKITMRSPDPLKDDTVILDLTDSKKIPSKPQTRRQYLEAFKTGDKNLQADLRAEQNCIDELTGVFNRFAYDNLSRLSTQIVIDVSVAYRQACHYGDYLADVIITRVAEEIENIMRSQWGSREIYRIEEARFLIQTTNEESHFDLIGRIKHRLDQVNIKIHHDGEMVHIPCILFRFGIGDSLESASEDIGSPEGY